VQLRAAKHQELVEGNLEEAIRLYQVIVEKNNGNRAVAAKALVRMGQCYETLGRGEAEKAYWRVLREYHEQGTEAAFARERLAALAKSAQGPSKPRFTKIQLTTKLYAEAGLSSNGQSLAFTDDGSIWVVPVHGKVDPNIAGVPVKLTEPMGARGDLTWSADRKWIAFNTPDGIYVIPAAGGDPRKAPVPKSRGGHPYLHRLSLSPDGSRMAYSAWETSPSAGREVPHLFTVPIGGGQPTQVTERPACEPAFSPDGTRIAYITEESPDCVSNRHQTIRHHSHVVVKAVDGGEPVVVSDLPGRPKGPVWSPDGRMIAFLQDTADDNVTRDLRIVAISENGNPLGDPTRIELPFRTITPLIGWTEDNRIGILSRDKQQEAIYTVPQNGGKAAQVSPAGGVASHPRWSPDGKQIYFRGSTGNIAFVPSGGGKPVDVPFETEKQIGVAVPGGGNQVSPNGKRIVFAGGFFEKDWRVNVWTVTVEGGKPSQVTDLPRSADVRWPCWSPDGESIAFITIDKSLGSSEGWFANINVVPAQGGEIERLTSASDGIAWSAIAWSPDGRHIAYFSRDWTLKLIPAGGGERTVICQFDRSGKTQPAGLGELFHLEMAWSPDAKQLAFTYGRKLWRVSLEDPTSVEIKTGLEEAIPAKLDWSPDGNVLAFTGVSGLDYELYLMEDFLHLVEPAH
jgi:Tol biopolymer transport system component